MLKDSSFTSADVSAWAGLFSGWSTSDAEADLELNSDLTPSSTTDQSKRNRNRAKAILALLHLMQGS